MREEEDEEEMEGGRIRMRKNTEGGRNGTEGREERKMKEQETDGKRKERGRRKKI